MAPLGSLYGRNASGNSKGNDSKGCSASKHCTQESDNTGNCVTEDLNVNSDVLTTNSETLLATGER